MLQTTLEFDSVGLLNFTKNTALLATLKQQAQAGQRNRDRTTDASCQTQPAADAVQPAKVRSAGVSARPAVRHAQAQTPGHLFVSGVTVGSQAVPETVEAAVCTDMGPGLQAELAAAEKELISEGLARLAAEQAAAREAKARRAAEKQAALFQMRAERAEAELLVHMGSGNGGRGGRGGRGRGRGPVPTPTSTPSSTPSTTSKPAPDPEPPDWIRIVLAVPVQTDGRLTPAEALAILSVTERRPKWLLSQVHPDRHPNCTGLAEAAAQRVNQAMDVRSRHVTVEVNNA